MIVFFHVKLSMKKTSMFLADFFFDHGKKSHEKNTQTTKPSGEDRPPTLWTSWHGWGHSTGGFLRDLVCSKTLEDSHGTYRLYIYKSPILKGNDLPKLHDDVHLCSMWNLPWCISTPMKNEKLPFLTICFSNGLKLKDLISWDCESCW